MNVDVFRPSEVRTADVLVVGGGAAGLTAALHADGRRVMLVGKTSFASGGSSVHAQGGVAAALDLEDSPRRHAEDTFAASGGLCDPAVVRRVTEEGPRRIAELLQRGTRLDRRSDGTLALGREGAHSRRRVAHAAGDATGSEIVRALAEAVRSAPRIEVVDGLLVLELILDRGRVVGAAAVDPAGHHVLLGASEVVLATGGIGALWHRTTNPPESSGDGLAMAIRAGAAVADLEFVQFHPTALDVGESRLPLLTEALRGEGAHLIDPTGVRFMVEEHPDAELAPRDVVARATWRRIQSHGGVFLDATQLGPDIERRFPTVAGLCRDHGYDLAAEPVPVTPAAHYHMGGVMVDARGRTSVPGLWACGEVARSGLHGANRLASNSLLEALVFGAAVGDTLAVSCCRPVHVLRLRDIAASAAVRIARAPWLDRGPSGQGEAADKLRRLMWRGVGLERDASGLKSAIGVLQEMRGAWADCPGELTNSILVAQMVARAAAARTESRGAHRRSDFPRSADCWLQPVVFRGELLLQPKPQAARVVAG